MPPRGQPAKRKRVSDPEPEEPPRRRTSDRIREASVTPAPALRRSTRASTETIESPVTQRDPPRQRQFARRTGGPLPPPTATRASEAPRSRSLVVVEVPPLPQTPRRNASRNSARTSLPPSQPQSQPRASMPRAARATPSRRDSSTFSLHSEEDSDEEGNSKDGNDEYTPPEAGPGPRTRAIRAGASAASKANAKPLRPVPQPDPAMFHQYMRPPPLPAPKQVVVDLSGSQSSASPVEETQVESLPPHREVTVVNGEEAYVIAGSDSGDDNAASSPGDKFDCPMKRCFQVCRSEVELGRHLREHADMYDPPKNATARKAAECKEIAELEKEHLLETGRLTEELNGVRFELGESEARATAAAESASQLATRLASVEEKERKAEEEIDSLRAKLTERDTKIKTLEDKLNAHEEVDRELEQIAAVHAPLDGDVPSTEVQIKLLHKKIKRMTSALKNTQSDIDFFRAQYQTASDSATAEVKRANELAAQVKTLQGKLTIGLKQRDLTAAAAAEKAKAAAKKSQQQLDLLLEQSRKTDDNVRRKAAAYGRLTRENQDLEAELHKARSRADELSKRNNELSDQVALLRGRLIGAFDTIEESDADDETDDDGPQPTPAVAPNAHLVPSFAPDNQSTRPSPALADTTLADGGIEMFRCKWALDNDSMCPEIFHTRDELEAHGLGHIEKLALAISEATPAL